MHLMERFVGMWFVSVSNSLACGVGICGCLAVAMPYVRAGALSLSALQTASKSSAK